MKPLYGLWQHFRQCVSCWSISQRKERGKKKKKRQDLCFLLLFRCDAPAKPSPFLCTSARGPTESGDVAGLGDAPTRVHGPPHPLRARSAPSPPPLLGACPPVAAGCPPGSAPGSGQRCGARRCRQRHVGEPAPLRSSSRVPGPEALASATESLCLSCCLHPLKFAALFFKILLASGFSNSGAKQTQKIGSNWLF